MIQLQALNHILQHNDPTFITFNNLDETYFSDYVQEFQFIKSHLGTYGKLPDMITMVNTFPGFDVIEVNEPANYLLDELYNDKNKRQLAKTFNAVRKYLNEEKIQEAMSLYVNAANDVVKAKHLDCVDITKDVSRYDDYVDRSHDYAKFYVKTGFPELDALIGGWDRNEELATIAARPGIGKSWVMLKSATAALQQGLNVGIYSGEMSERKVGYRFDTLVSNISNYAITKGIADVQNDYKRFIDELPHMFSGSLKVITPAMINGPAGVQALKAFIQKEELDILFVDQHSLLEDDRHARNPVDRAANISRDLKNLQVMCHIPIIAVSQQNRELAENGAGTQNIAQSDRISQDSTIILFLEQSDNVLTLNLAKSRDSEAFKKLKYAIDLNRGVFQYLPAEDDALQGSGAEELRKEYDCVDGEGNVF